MPKNKLSPVKKVENKDIAKIHTHDQLRDMLVNAISVDGDPKTVLNKLGKIYDEYIREKNPDDALCTKLRNEINIALPLVTLETHYLASEATSGRYRPFVMQFANDVIAEYHCTTSSEKALAETVAIAYGRILELSASFNESQRIEFLSNEKTGYYTMIAKELDRAHRQFTSALLVLKQLKTPNLEVNIKAKNAFFAQNQQVNTATSEQSGDNNDITYENVDPT